MIESMRYAATLAMREAGEDKAREKQSKSGTGERVMTPDEEIKWKKIKDFPNYSVSNTGLVRNDITGKLKKLQHDKSGYLVCDLYHHQKRKLYKIHRLIAEAFISNPEGKPHINHINGIKDDNRIENLEWCTSEENNYHAWNVLDSDNRRKKMAEHARNRVWSDESREKVGKNKKGKKLSEQARKNMSDAHKGKEGSNKKSIECIETKIVYESIKQASEDMGILRTSIQNVLSGLSENARGYHFRRVV
jgi:hypothetical protein